MASKTFYFLDALATGSNYLQLQDGGSPPVQARVTTGWIVDSVAPTVYSNMDSQTERASSTLTGTALPNQPPFNALGDCFRTQDKYTGDFSLGNWGFIFQVEGETRASTTTDGRLRLRVWKSDSATGATPTEITSGTAILTSQFTNLANSAFQNITGVAGLSAFSLNNEYLFFQVALQIDGAGAHAAADVHLAVGSNNRFDTPDFTEPLPGLNASLSKTLDDISKTQQGTVATTVIFNKVLDNISQSLLGTVATNVSFSKTLDDVTLLASGTVETPGATNSASLNAILDNITSSLNATASDFVDFIKTLDGIVFSSVATSSIKAISSNTLGDISVSIIANNAITASETKILENIATDLDGTVANAINSSITLGDILYSSIVDIEIKGALNSVLGNVTLASEGIVGTPSSSATLSATLGNISASLLGILDVKAISNIALANITLSSTGTVETPINTNDALLIATLDDITSLSSSTVQIFSSLSKTLDDIVFVTNGSLSILGTLDVTLNSITISSTVTTVTSTKTPSYEDVLIVNVEDRQIEIATESRSNLVEYINRQAAFVP